MNSELRHALRRMLDDSDKVREFALTVKAATPSWRASDPFGDRAVRHINKILNGDGNRNQRRNADIDWIGIAIDVTGLDYFSPIIIQRVAMARIRIELAEQADATQARCDGRVPEVVSMPERAAVKVEPPVRRGRAR